MGVYIDIIGTLPCPICGATLKDWQCKQLDYDGYPVAILMQRYKLNKKMSGEMYHHCATCGMVTYQIDKGKLKKA